MSVGAIASFELESVETHLNSIKTLEADFIQTNADGSSSSGKIWLKKPGKLRFEYEDPDSLLIVANLGFLVVIDKLSDSPAQRYLTKSTPLSFFLEELVSISKENFNFDIDKSENLVKITMPTFTNQRRSELIVIFKLNPLILTGWIIKTAGDEMIEIELIEPKLNKSIDEEIHFGIGGEIQKQNSRISN